VTHDHLLSLHCSRCQSSGHVNASFDCCECAEAYRLAARRALSLMKRLASALTPPPEDAGLETEASALCREVKKLVSEIDGLVSK
jgi:hypothetical protein